MTGVRAVVKPTKKPYQMDLPFSYLIDLIAYSLSTPNFGITLTEGCWPWLLYYTILKVIRKSLVYGILFTFYGNMLLTISKTSPFSILWYVLWRRAAITRIFAGDRKISRYGYEQTIIKSCMCLIVFDKYSTCIGFMVFNLQRDWVYRCSTSWNEKCSY